MKKIIAVSGSNEGDENLTADILLMAEEVGRYIAGKEGILLCGGLGGIMEAACRGAKNAGGVTIGLLPRGREEANAYVDIPLATHLGYFRNSLLMSAADSVIAICGRWGTLNEIAYAVSIHKPVIILSGSGGVSDILSGGEFLSGMKHKPRFARTAKAAVDLAFKLA